jgi:hypothetical protein
LCGEARLCGDARCRFGGGVAAEWGRHSALVCIAERNGLECMKHGAAGSRAEPLSREVGDWITSLPTPGT